MAVALIGGLLVVVRAGSVDGSVAPPAVSTPPASDDPTTPTVPATPAPTPKPSTAPSGPPPDTVHVDDRYRARYAGRYVGWDDLLDAGRKLPQVSDRCRAEWRRPSATTPWTGTRPLTCASTD